MDLCLYRQVYDLEELLRPVAISLDSAQSDDTTLADNYHIMKRLMVDPVLASHHDTVRKRRDQAILPCHMIAYLLHPKYSSKDMDLQDAETARAWLVNQNPEFLDDKREVLL